MCVRFNHMIIVHLCLEQRQCTVKKPKQESRQEKGGEIEGVVERKREPLSNFQFMGLSFCLHTGVIVQPLRVEHFPLFPSPIIALVYRNN